MSSLEILLNLLEVNQKYLPYYDDKLSNHLSMALIALYKLDAAPEDLERFNEAYQHKLVLAEADSALVDINLSNWKDYLGEHRYHLSFLSFFEGELRRLNSISEIISVYFSELAAGIGAAAFHPLIRLSYALILDNIPDKIYSLLKKKLKKIIEKEVVISLAYLADSYLLLHEPESAFPQSIDEAVESLFSIKDRGLNVPKGGLIFERMQRVSASESYAALNRLLNSSETHLSRIAAAILELYCVNPDFIMLHALTSCHALRVVLPYVKNKAQVIQSYWSALVAAILCVDFSQFHQAPHGECKNWPELFSRARASNEEHMIKIAYSTHEEYVHYNNDRYKKLFNPLPR